MERFAGRYALTAALLSGISVVILALDLTGYLRVRAVLSQAITPVYYVSSYFHEIRRGREEREALSALLARRSLALGRAEELRRENEALRAALALEGFLPYELLPAKVVERRAGEWRRAVTVATAGPSRPRVGMPVIGTAGLVGRVNAVRGGWAEVELITNNRVRFVVTHAASGLKAIYGADDAGQGFLTYVPRTAAVNVGDVIVTAADSAVFPPGLVVGTVSTVRRPFDSIFLEVHVAPAEDFDRLDNVFLLNWAPPARGR